MKAEQAIAEAILKYGEKTVKLKYLVNTGASRSVISKRIAERLRAFTPLKKPYELKTADKEGKLRIIGYCNLDIISQGVEVPSGLRFEVAENLREDLDLIIGRPEIGA